MCAFQVFLKLFHAHLVAEYSHDEICRKPDAGFLGWKCTAAAAVYLRSAYRIHVNAMKANRARWVLTQVNSPRRGRGKCDIKFSSPLRASRDPCLFGDFPFSPNEPTRLLTHVERVTANNGIEKRGSAYHFYFHHLFFPRGDIHAFYWKFIYLKIYALFDAIKMKKI